MILSIKNGFSLMNICASSFCLYSIYSEANDAP